MKRANYSRYIWLFNLYGPYLGAGVSVKEHNKDLTRFLIQMKMRWFNRNIFGTHFGGSLYSMCDPWFVFILLNALGTDYIIWDISAKIKFLKPGKKRVTALFDIPKERLDEIRIEMQDTTEKRTFWFTTEVKNESGEVVAQVEKEIYIRRKS